MIICNWKMFGDLSLVQQYRDVLLPSDNLVVCPPFPLLTSFGDTFKLGAQNCHEAPEGAYTGEVSAKMLSELGCRYVLLGHSERRQYYAETDDLVSKKSNVAMAYGLTPIVCVGSSAETEALVIKDLEQQLTGVSLENGEIVIAYEPLWSIGTNRVPSIEHIACVTDWIKTKGFSRVVYGGSVNQNNAKAILSVCNGLLVGRASLDPHVIAHIMDDEGDKDA